MKLFDYLMSQGVSRPVAKYAEREFRFCAMQRLALLKTDTAFKDSGLRDLFKPLSKDVFSKP